MDGFKALARVISLTMSQDAFLGRCMDIYQLLERLRPGPLKRLLLSLGMTRDDLKKLGDVGALRYLSTLAQLAALAEENDESLVEDFPQLRTRWDKDRRLPLLAPILALGTLRVARSHPQGADGKAKIGAALQAFGLDPQAMKGGWGLALDGVYDTMIESLSGVNLLIADHME